MCAEAAPLQCHRQMIADALTALHGFPVVRILGAEGCEEHQLTPFGRVVEGVLIYPAPQRRLF